MADEDACKYFMHFLTIPYWQDQEMSRLYIVQHEMNTNSSIDAGVLFKADNVGDLSYQQFDNEDISNHGTPDDYCQPGNFALNFFLLHFCVFVYAN